MHDMPAMGEGNVEHGCEDVACATQSHIAAESRDLVLGTLDGKDGDGGATNTLTWNPSSEMGVGERDAAEDRSPAPIERSRDRNTTDEPERGRRPRRVPDARSPPSSSALVDRPFKFTQARSGSSSDSDSTVTQSDTEQPQPRDMDPEKARRPQSGSAPLSRPDPLTFLEPDSPDITPESIRRSIEESAARWRPRKSPSSASSASSASDVFSQTDPETSPSSSPTQSTHSSPTPHATAPQFPPDRRPPKSYGTPEMPRGPVNHPHIPPNSLQPRLGGSNYAKHLPRAEKMPLSGYQLVASKLSSSHPQSLPIRPIYRRFETLSHRILLHLQDELAELEEQLHRLDTADTQTRRLRDCFLPASRRTEVLAGGELQWHRTDILGKIGYKLEQYSASSPPFLPSAFPPLCLSSRMLTSKDRVLASFVKTQGVERPRPFETEEYRSFLEQQKPIAELETRFLDAPDDLIALQSPPPSLDCLSSGAPTPRPRADRPSSPSLPEKEAKSAAPAPTAPARRISIPSLAAAIAVAVLLPVLSFASVPGLPGRMTVIWLVAAGVLNPLLQASGGLQGRIDGRDAVACAGIYGGAMSVVALVFS